MNLIECLLLAILIVEVLNLFKSYTIALRKD